MDTLTQITGEEVRKYAGSGRGANIRLHPILDHENQTFTVLALDIPQRKEYAGVIIFARIVNDVVVIEEDNTDKPLLNALLQRGIPREKIVLAYQGEPIPDADRYELKGVKQPTP
jgi:hypothetical protein